MFEGISEEAKPPEEIFPPVPSPEGKTIPGGRDHNEDSISTLTTEQIGKNSGDNVAVVVC